MFEVGWLVNHTKVVVFTYNFGCSHVVLEQGWVGRTSLVPIAVAGTAVAQGIALPLNGARFDPHRCGGSIDSEKRVKWASHGGRSIPSESRPYLFAIPVDSAGAGLAGG
jgi:hypothetical protein